MKIRRPVGIDLGTTNSCVGVMDDTQREIYLYETESGSSTTPSCVWYDEETNKVVVGSDAYLRRGSTPAPVVSVKRNMGKIVFSPLGQRARVPRNLPSRVKQSLCETRDERLERYLARLEAPNPLELEAVREAKRANPPMLWVMDQTRRLEIYLDRLDDAAERALALKDPPLLWLPDEISALILAEERAQILLRLQALEPDKQHVVDRCVITVPAYFGAEQMEATKEAGYLAELEVLELLQEPSAAALYYCWKLKIEDGLFTVFDLGGGTFDVSVLRLQNRWPSVLGISGDNLLGGDDFDKTLAEHIRATLAARYTLDLRLSRPDDRRIWDGLVLLAEGAKKALTRESAFLLRDTSLTDLDGNRLNIDMKITRAQFEALIAPIVEKCIPRCWEALARTKLKAGVSLSDVDQIFLVGGATHVPFVQREVRRRFCSASDAIAWTGSEIETIASLVSGDDPDQTEELRRLTREMMQRQERTRCAQPELDNPDLCVAMGAAVQAAAKGVEVQSDRAAISVTSPRSTTTPTAFVAGKVTPSSAAVDLRGATIELRNELSYSAQTDLKRDGGFAFAGVPLSDIGATVFALTLCSEGGEELAWSEVAIARVGKDDVVAVRGEPKPSVPRPYSLEVLRHGLVTRKVLVETGASLPIDRRPYELAVPDPNTGVLQFRVFQGSRLLKNIEAFVDPAVRPGTRITFTFSVGLDHMMRASYQFAGDPEEHPVVIEPPDSLKPSAAEMEGVAKDIEQELELLDEVKRDNLRIRFGKLKASAHEAEQSGDEAKLIDRYEQLQGLRDDIRRANVPLKPAWQEFEKVFKTCNALLEAIKIQQADYADAPVRQTLTAIHGKAQEAYQKKEQDRYTVHWGALTDNEEALSREYSRSHAAHVPEVQQARMMIESGIKRATVLGQKADQIIRGLEAKAAAERDPDKRASLGKLEAQCRQCVNNIDTCTGGYQELKGTYTADPKAAMDKCHSYSPILSNAEAVLDQKQSFLEGKTVTGPIIPTEI